MCRIKPFHPLIAVLAAWALALTNGRAEAVSRLSTRFLARGEQALLEVAVAGVQPTGVPEIPAVEGVSFILRPVEVLGYLGPNGSGKSTTVKMVIGMIHRNERGVPLFPRATLLGSTWVEGKTIASRTR